jgi:hypothetical protein
VRPWVADKGDGLQIWRLAVNIFKKQSWPADKGWSSSLGVDKVLIIPQCKNPVCYEMLCRILELAGPCENDSEPSGSITGGECLD